MISKEESKQIIYTKKLLRQQRHDYMNYLQIIYGYLQLGKVEEGIGQIKKVIQLNLNSSQIYKLSLFYISVFLEKSIREMEDLDYMVDIQVKNNTKCILRFIDNEKEIIEKLKIIFNDFMEKGEKNIEFRKTISIRIEEFQERISFMFFGEDKISELIKSSEDIKIEQDDEKVSIIFKCKNPEICLKE